MTINYTNNIPNPPNAPSSDVPLLQANTNALSSIVAIDHQGFGATISGYHTVIHQSPQSGNPGAIASVGQTYTKTVSGDQQLFYESGGGVVNQLTGPNAASAASNGYTWIGGILIQWGNTNTVSGGSFASGTANGTVTFSSSNIAFPNNCFFVVSTAYYTTAGGAPSGASSVNINQSTLSKTIFDWTFNSNSSKYKGIYWYAIGN